MFVLQICVLQIISKCKSPVFTFLINLITPKTFSQTKYRLYKDKKQRAF